LGGVVYGAVAIARHGFSAREKPSRLEEWLARHARKIATPSDAKQLRNPHPATAEGLAAARAHWADHCASCHALDGSGNTALGRNLYPKAPDMRDRITQNLSDGELYDIITNGVRFTGMPAWGGEHTPQETWQLVAFIRRLPTLSADELKQMKAQSAKNEAHTHEHKPGAPTHAH
jgi:mono/diheme cytochrome c family protein